MISKTHTVAQKPRRRQLNSKVCGSKSAIFRILSSLRPLCSNNDNSKKNGSSTHRNVNTKLMLITAHSSTTTQHLHSFKFTVVNKSCSQHCPAAVHCEGRHFLILFTCVHVVSFPDQRPLVWELDKYTSEIAS